MRDLHVGDTYGKHH